ncbi:MAG: double zinc ribbon domain-containing protein [Synergistaceae bacterium]|nr:double zinc ribbon domain-containing protein [Synergistaceae bacterium]
MTALEILAHMLWPVSCPVCGAVAELLCGTCLRSMLRPQLPRCLWCGEPAPCKIHGEGAGGGAKIRAGSVYEGHMKDVILALKYGGYEATGPRLGRALGNFFARPDVDVLIPVPLHLKSKRRYNQAESIAKGLGEVWGIEVRSAARWTADVPPRAGLGMNERLALSSSAFAFDENITKIPGLRAGFVDDVCTTGSTLAALAKAAKACGVSAACAFVAAHVPPVR